MGGENMMLRQLFGRERWDSGSGTACGKWNINLCYGGPMLLVSVRVPEAYSHAAEIIEHLKNAKTPPVWQV